MIRFASLGSGSKGNATVVMAGATAVLVDCGFGLRETERRLAKLGLEASQISAVLITHEHGDHMKGVGAFAKKYAVPVHMTPGTHHAKPIKALSQVKLIVNYEPFTVNDLHVTPVPVPHDAREPAQFVFTFNEYKMGVLTDIGSITPHVVEAYSGCHGLLIEANHDLDMLTRGSYPPSLKARVSGAWGHLSNTQTRALLEQIDMSKARHVVVGHISQQNNTRDAAEAALSGLDRDQYSVHFACQEEGFDWLDLESV